MLPAVPNIQLPKRAKTYRKPKGRAPTEEEFKRILNAVPEIVGSTRADSWSHLIKGLWWGGLRLGEALELWWDRSDKLRIDLTGERPVLHIPAELEKGHQDRVLPIAPEFAEFLLNTPPHERTGRVFRPMTSTRKPPTPNHVIKIICAIGEKSNVVVHVEARNGKVKHASAHDFRRAFGDRWSLRVMPPVLMQLMRHESIETTMKYYVGRTVEATAEVIWGAYWNAKGGQTANGHAKRDTLRDTSPNSTLGEKSRRDAS
jgi:integrase